MAGYNLLAQAPDLLHKQGKVRICEATVKDTDAGLTPGHYGHNENITMTICVPGAKNLTLKFNSFCTEKYEDVLSIFDGPDTNSTLLGRWSGTIGPGTITSKDSCITLHFKSDKSVACTGWSADLTTTIIVPPSPVFSMNRTVNCKDNSALFKSNVSIHCDSFLVANANLSGPKNLGIASITPTNCINGYTKTFKVNFNNIADLNGRYTFGLTTNWVDFCGNKYTYYRSTFFDLLSCPLKVILTTSDTLICKGSCARLTTSVSGGNPSKYIYSWTPSGLSGAGPITVCPTVRTTYILRVTDGISIPSADTITINVLDPPMAQADTEVCYTSGNFTLKASPAGGTWYGKGIVNGSTGEFKPVGNYGANKVWYQIGQCADTVIVTSQNAWALENVFCKNTTGRTLWWTAPANGTYSGPRVQPNGFFDPDTTEGTYTLKYNWKGCIIDKKVQILAGITVPRFDTACESSTGETLTFSPKGIYPNWFPGLTNSYWGTYNPSQMGGPQTRLVIWNAGNCRDSTYLTVLGIDAGPIDTFCPKSGNKTLSNYFPTTGYTWTKGKGILDSIGNSYNPNYSNKSFSIDTLEISSAKCKDRTYIYNIATQVRRTDTLKICFESSPQNLTFALTGMYPLGGTWSGPGVSNAQFNPTMAGYGYHPLTYSVNGCIDTFYAFVRPKPIVQADTQMCIDAPQFTAYKKDLGGSFAGAGIVNAGIGIFRPSAAGAGLHNITYTSAIGCKASFTVRVDGKANVNFVGTPTEYCYRTNAFPLVTDKTGGIFSGPGVLGSTFNPSMAGSGPHVIGYEFVDKTCTSNINLNVLVKDTLQLDIDPISKDICPGELVWLKGLAKGGDPSNHLISWSNGKTGLGTFVSPLYSTTYTVNLTDGCSDPVNRSIPIRVNPRPYFNVLTSDPVCFGNKGWAKAYFPNPAALKLEWNTFPVTIGDSIYQSAGNTYRLSATYTSSGCSSDTNITIPGFKAITADFATYVPNGLPCISNIQPELLVFDGSTGGTAGTWTWGDGTSEPYIPGDNPKHSYGNQHNNYTIKLSISNDGGCLDSTYRSICYKDTILIFIPNAYSPNGDGRNDVFRISTIGPTELEMIIYNRWGEILFRSKDLNFTWDGKHNGKTVPDGFYVYRLTYKSPKTGSLQRNGVIHIVN